MTESVQISLIKACVSSDLNGVKHAIESGADPDLELDWEKSVDDHTTAFSAVIESGDLEIAKYLIDIGANPNIGCSITSVQQLGKGTLSSFIEAGLYVNDDDDSALFSAIEQGDTELASLLLNNGANPNAVSSWREGNAFEFANEQGVDAIIQLLKEKGGRKRDGESPLVRKDVQSAKAFIEAVIDGDDDTAISLLDKQFDFNEEVEHEYSDEWVNATPLVFVCEKGNKNLVAELIKRGANVNDSSGQALVNATENEHLDIVAELIQAGAYANASGDRALFSAIEKGSKETTALLLENGANPNAHSWNGSPLSIAAKRGNTDIVQLLLDNGANPTFFRSSALFSALESGYADVAKKLIEAGGNLTANKQKLEFILSVGFSGSVIQLLADHGHSIESPDENWREILHDMVENAESSAYEEE